MGPFRASRWDFENRRFEERLVPCTCSLLIAPPLEGPVTCPECGASAPFFEMVPSKRWFSDEAPRTAMVVCRPCYERECEDEYAAMFGSGR